MRVVTVAEDVLVALPPPEERFDDANSGWVRGARGVLVVDAPLDRQVVAHWIERAAPTRTPVRWLVNTHWHEDHVRSSADLLAASPGLEILGHASLLQDLPERTAAEHGERVERLARQVPQARAALEEGRGLSGQELDGEQRDAQRRSIEAAEEWLRDHRDDHFRAPTLAYREELDLDIGFPVRLLHFHGHTRGDTVVFLPSRRIAFTGDLLDELPFVGHGSPRSWIAALDVLAELPVDTFVPGHGEPFGAGHLDLVRSYLQTVVDLVDGARSRGWTLERTLEEADLEELRRRLVTDTVSERFFDGTRDAALTAAWNEP